MTKPSLWIPRRLSDATMARALRDYHVITNPDDTPGTAAEIIAMSAQVDAMFAMPFRAFQPSGSGAIGRKVKNYSQSLSGH